MQTEQTCSRTWPFLGHAEEKESKLKLTLEVHHYEDVSVVHCRGRITYRDEAAQLSSVLGEMLPRARQLILEMSAVETVDSAGLGEIAVVLMWAQAYQCRIKVAAPRPHVRNLLELTNLASVLKIYPTLDEAIYSARSQAA
jgi:anti-sigma B factor antagonist